MLHVYITRGSYVRAVRAYHQGVQGDCVPLPEREVSSLYLLFSREPLQVARKGYLHRYAYYHEMQINTASP